MLATTQSIPIKTHDGNSSPSSQHSHHQSSRESLLSKSLGHHEASASSLISFHRRSSEMSEITHCGYLLKRSNHPFRDIPAFPLDQNNSDYDGPPYSPFAMTPTESANVSRHSSESVPPGEETAPDNNASFTVAEIIDHPKVANEHNTAVGNSRYDNTVKTKPQHLDELDIKNGHSLTSSPSASLAKSMDFLSSFFGIEDTHIGAEEEEEDDDDIKRTTPTNMEIQTSVNGIQVKNGHDTTTTAPTFVSPDPPLPSTASVPIQHPNNNNIGTTRKSVPISFNNDITSATSIPIVHRNDSAPITYSTQHTTISSNNGGGTGRISQPPPDFVDPHDGHIWRAKYCVLEDGILYFYRNVTDGESNEAKAERSNYSRSGGTNGNGTLGNGTSTAAIKMAEDVMDLSKSPMARPRMLTTIAINNNTASPLHHENSFHDLKYHHALWEKRVALDCVGAVRSAELEYGPCSFELLAVEDSDASSSSGSTDDTLDDDDSENEEGEEIKNKDNNFQDRLILRAGNTEEMKDWLLQFHRSLASVITHIVEAAVESQSPAVGFPIMALAGGVATGTSATGGLLGPAGDIHHVPQTFAIGSSSGIPPPPLSQSVGGGGFLSNHLTNINRVPSASGSTAQQKKKHHHHHPAALSHGHGRSGMHRRRPYHGASASVGGDVVSAGSPSSSTMGGASGNGSPKHSNKKFPTLLLEPRTVTQQTGRGWNEMDGGFLISPSSSSTDAGLVHGDAAISTSAKEKGESSLPLVPVQVVAPSPLPSLKQQDNKDLSFPSTLPLTLKPPGGGTKYIPPHLRQKKSSSEDSTNNSGGRYIPPHLRGKRVEPSTTATDMVSPAMCTDTTTNVDATNGTLALSMEESNTNPPLSGSSPKYVVDATTESSPISSSERDDEVLSCPDSFKMGGCADPSLSVGSILDSKYKGRKASKIGYVRTDAFGCVGGGLNNNNDYDNNNNSQNANHNEIVLVTDGSDASNAFVGDVDDGTKDITSLEWEVGAVSECGIRNSNEDSYLIASNLIKAFESLPALQDVPENSVKPLWTDTTKHQPGLFAIFDGHCGNQAARFAAEKLLDFVLDESLNEGDGDDVSEKKTPLTPTEEIRDVLLRAIAKLDDRFCELCTEDGREWESGSTAIVAMIVQEHVVLANLGDCRGVISCSTGSSLDDAVNHNVLQRDGWTELEIDDFDVDETGSETQWGGIGHSGDNDDGSGINPSARCWWKEVAEIHSPSREDERLRIEKANGWVTTETEMPIGQLKRMDLYDEDVVEILKRCFSDRYQSSSTPSKRCNAAPHRILQISRVCGELAVSRALGDRDFKAAFNKDDDDDDNENGEDLTIPHGKRDDENSSPTANTDVSWENPDLFLPWPDNHTQRFSGDLVSAIPEIQTFKVGQKGAVDEFLLLACDGLWDVMDPDDAVRVTRGLLFQKKWTAKKAAARLAEIAIHLGSSDNITVILISFSTTKS